MDKTINLLGGLLAAQLLVALWAFSGGTDLAARQPGQALLEFDAESVTRIKVEGPGGGAVSLSKKSGGWVLPESADAPANAAKIGGLLERLAGLEKVLPVAVTAGALERFEVSEDRFQRRVTLGGPDVNLAVLYLGTTPGLRKVHARVPGENAVYSVAFAVFETPVKADDWLDTGLLHLQASELEGIEVSGLTLSRSGKSETGQQTPDLGWNAEGLGEGEGLNQSKVTELVRTLSAVDVRGALGTEAKEEFKQDTPALTLVLHRAEGGPVTWTLSKPENGENYVLKSSEHPWYFDLASWAAQSLEQAAQRDRLLDSPADTSSPEAETSPQGAPGARPIVEAGEQPGTGE